MGILEVRPRGWVGVMVAAAIGFASVDARAQSADAATAEVLYDEGKRLMGEGKFAEACPKFFESNRLDPGVGSLLRLADCYEKSGRTASAWASFREAASFAKRLGDEKREQLARDRAQAIEPKLARMIVRVKTPEQGLEVKRDGAVLGEVVWGTAVPIDPGKHVIEATAPGKKTFTKTVDVPTAGGSVEVEVPALELAPAEVEAAAQTTTGPAAPVGEEPKKSSGTLRIVSYAAFGVGAIGLGVGTVFALSSAGTRKDVEQMCPGDQCPVGRRAEVLELQTKANNQGRLAVVGLITGVVGVGAGAALFFLSPAPKAAGTDQGRTVRPWVGLGSVGVTGSF